MQYDKDINIETKMQYDKRRNGRGMRLTKGVS
jgi:hypothetical protein